ncbi:beta-ketoacyl-[acyl-carrier-protein] synthase family protein [Alienimonas californiensis]|uniref:3-oxoacyl-[acyl-carrier-protein] synthase 2 n=1 Tax=Alienimonas californiensis TaxID=2527989 RepID=A0A517PDU2_9PLAN|nr:beta-ketoacyl synthase N-terminal-like domain-containing protein [Alienimonas californiensis]QDT17501.1 3-oxoacyl-[acyl-carrier-protein] synthase 2 [Alienimonas californiensis]
MPVVGGDGPAVAVTGVGFGVAKSVDPWRNLLAGRSDLRTVDLPPLNRPAAGASPRFVDPALAGSSAMMAAAVAHAVADAGLGGPCDEAGRRLADPRCGWALGASKSDAADWRSPAGGPGWPWLGANGRGVPDDWQATGPRLTPVAACATGVVAVIRGAEMIRQGVCDRVICGAADASLHPLILASFARLGVLTDPGDDPAGCMRPFDEDRSGFAIGEGAAAFLLERADLARPGTIYATVTGTGLASAAVKLTDVDATGDPVRRVLHDCTAGVRPDLLGLHGTATRANDPAEAAGVRAAFADGAAVPAFASKGATGHLLGAAGAVELAFTLLALRDGVVPPTLNLSRQDPACGLNLSPTARPAPLETAAKVSLGFGGTVAAVALRRGDRVPSTGDAAR